MVSSWLKKKPFTIICLYQYDAMSISSCSHERTGAFDLAKLLSYDTEHEKSAGKTLAIYSNIQKDAEH